MTGSSRRIAQLLARAAGRPTDAILPGGMRLRTWRDDEHASSRPAEVAFLAVYLQPGDLFVDLGAGTGAATLIASAWNGPKGRAIALEPDAARRARLAENVRRNALERRVDALDPGAGLADALRDARVALARLDTRRPELVGHEIELLDATRPPAILLAEEPDHELGARLARAGYELGTLDATTRALRFPSGECQVGVVVAVSRARRAELARRIPRLDVRRAAARDLGLAA